MTSSPKAKRRPRQMLARQKEIELEDGSTTAGNTPDTSFKPVPQVATDWKKLRQEVTAQYPEALAYLAK